MFSRAQILQMVIGSLMVFSNATFAMAEPAKFSCELSLATAARGGHDRSITFDESTGDYAEISASRRSVVSANVRLARSQSHPRSFDLVSTNGTVLSSLEVYGGHPLQPLARLIVNDRTRPCAINAGAASLYERLIDDPAMKTQIESWKSWIAARPGSCDPQFDSAAYFVPGATRVALVLHGYSSSPGRMNEVAKLLLDNNTNVLVPRLSRHFTYDLHDLDNANATEWLRDAEESFAIARRLSSSVTLVGYSLGGLLASRLAFSHPSQVERMILIAPAWKLQRNVAWGTSIGIALGISMNDLRNQTISCNTSAAYQPASGGQQIENLIAATEKRYGPRTVDVDGVITTRSGESAFSTLRVPRILITSPSDEVVSSADINSMCETGNSPCSLVEVEDRSHTELLNSMNLQAATARGRMTMAEALSEFLNRRTNARR